MQVPQLILGNNTVQNVTVGESVLWDHPLGSQIFRETEHVCLCVLGVGCCGWQVICVQGFLKAGAFC